MNAHLQIALGLAAPDRQPEHLIRKPVPLEVRDYLSTHDGIGWQQLRAEVAERFGLLIAPSTLLKWRGVRS